MDNNGKIVVVAGNRDQFQYWLRHNIIPITSKHDIRNLQGIRIKEVCYEGTYYKWFDEEVDATIRQRMKGGDA